MTSINLASQVVFLWPKKISQARCREQEVCHVSSPRRTPFVFVDLLGAVVGPKSKKMGCSSFAQERHQRCIDCHISVSGPQLTCIYLIYISYSWSCPNVSTWFRHVFHRPRYLAVSSSVAAEVCISLPRKASNLGRRLTDF